VPCIFADRASLVVADGGALDWDGYVTRVALAVRRLSPPAQALVCVLPVPGDASPTGLLAQATHTLLGGLYALSYGKRALLYRDINQMTWRFSAFERDYFPLVLSPAYTPRHPRYVAWPHPLLMLQPEESFTACNVTSREPRRARISAAVEQNFVQAGRQYHGTVTRIMPKAYRIVKALTPASAPVRWWETPPLANVDNKTRRTRQRNGIL
jgi:hypothetical protein